MVIPYNRKERNRLNISDHYKSIEQVVGYEQYLSDFENEVMFPFTQDKETEITDFFEILTNEPDFHLIMPAGTTVNFTDVIFYFRVTHYEEEARPPLIAYIDFEYEED